MVVLLPAPPEVDPDGGGDAQHQGEDEVLLPAELVDLDGAEGHISRIIAHFKKKKSRPKLRNIMQYDKMFVARRFVHFFPHQGRISQNQHCNSIVYIVM